MKNFLTFLATVCLTMSVWAQDKGFVHVATADNISTNWTYIDHPDLNGNPDARFLFSQRFNGVNNNHPTGIWYNGTNWTIYNEDLSPMPVGAAFNIYIPADSPVTVHIADASNTTDYFTKLSGYTEEQWLFYNTYWNPHTVYNPYVYGNDYWEGDRYLYVETFDPIPYNSAFFVMRGEDISATLGSVSSNAGNTSGSHLIINHPALNNNPNAVFVYSHYYGYLDNNSDLPTVTEAEYDVIAGRWQIYSYGGTFPEGVWFDFIIPDQILGTNEVQEEVSKISIYPNPVADKVNISSSKKEIQEVQIYDATGKQVKVFTQNGKTVSFDISALPGGMYITKVLTDEGWFSQKLIKK